MCPREPHSSYIRCVDISPSAYELLLKKSLAQYLGEICREAAFVTFVYVRTVRQVELVEPSVIFKMKG